jgi:hypothetical protein
MNQIFGLIIMAVVGGLCAYIAYKQGARDERVEQNRNIEKLEYKLEQAKKDKESLIAQVDKLEVDVSELKAEINVMTLAAMQAIKNARPKRCAKCRRFIPADSPSELCEKCTKPLLADAEVGDTLVLRDGSTQKIREIDSNYTYNGYHHPIIGDVGHTFATSGKYNLGHGDESDLDVVAMIKKGER